MYKAGVKRGALIAFLKIFIRSCVITGPGTNMSVFYGAIIYETNPVCLCIIPFSWFNSAYFCELIALRLNDTEKVNITIFF